MDKPPAHAGLHHLALLVKNFDACRHFYTNILGMQIVWQPDDDNLYLSSGNDNLALHRAPADYSPGKHHPLDHMGFFLKHRDEVDAWHTYLQNQGCHIMKAPKDHRDGTRSFYCADPDGNVVQMIYYPLSQVYLS